MAIKPSHLIPTITISVLDHCHSIDLISNYYSDFVHIKLFIITTLTLIIVITLIITIIIILTISIAIIWIDVISNLINLKLVSLHLIDVFLKPRSPLLSLIFIAAID